MGLEDSCSDNGGTICKASSINSSSSGGSSLCTSFGQRQQLSEPDQGRVGCHRCVLMARSPVFKAMLSHNMMESLNGEINIPDFSLTVVKIMLHFIYTGELSGIGNK